MTTNGNERQLPVGFDKYEDIARLYKSMQSDWNKVGVTDRYKTGNPIMDSYLGGGFGGAKGGEVILVHSTAKAFKSTITMWMLRHSIEAGEKMGWIILEGGTEKALRTLRQTYVGKYPEYEKCDEVLAKNAANIFSMSRDMRRANFDMDMVITWMKNLVATHGVKLFYIDPVGYLADYSNDIGIPDWKKESVFMKKVSWFCEDTDSTVLMVQHNVKGSNIQLHREAAIGGSKGFSNTATKVIEIRKEGYIDEQHPEKGKRMSMEMYFARDVRDHQFTPIIVDVMFHQDGKGKWIYIPTFRDPEDANSKLKVNKQVNENRQVWLGQLSDNASDLEDLLNE